MAELQERLQAALGDGYRIEQELGGGGMSRVFVAHETALGRRVVVKVLPPEMGAGVNVERFRREIQLAAGLQHPHVVQLLTAGASGDLLYYVMPFVDGESLRAKLARERELPVGEAVRILRDVVDALAYAHAQGVVHRDIKPDNVLLSRKHAVVTDFGVARAVSASTGSATSLTSLGVALGTPAYMAPEQAAADPNVDHRADLYAVGALAYEMLSGRPPFTGITPQSVLAAHVTQAPESLLAHRPTIPAGLNSVVMRCLEKHPADRWQTAEELLVQLEAMATPTGGMAPTSPTISSGTEAALRQSHPVRVAALFGAAALGMLGVVYVLMMRLGLPGWVFAGAVALLVVGLPVILWTGRLERQRALARTNTLRLPGATGLGRWLTWRRAITGGAMAFAGLGVATTLYMVMRLLGIGPAATLVSAGVLSDREPILITDFTNRTADSTLGLTLTEAFRVDLAQSRIVRLVGPEQVAQALRLMQRPVNTVLDLTLAREVAQRQGIKAIVVGQVDPVGSSYVLSASLISPTDGTVLTAVRETADNAAALIPALDRLSRALRERIGESLRTIRAAEPLEHVTTGSLAALQKYSQSMRLENIGESEAAIALLSEATSLDTGFAMAYRKLAAILGNTGASLDQQLAAATRAYQHRDRLPDLERHLATAYYFLAVRYDPGAAVAAYRSVLSIDPDNTTAMNNLALELADQRAYVEAESLALRASRLHAAYPYFVNTIYAQLGQGHVADARASAARFAQALPESPYLPWITVMMEGSLRNLAAARTAARQIETRWRTSPVWREQVAGQLATIAQTEGRLAEAERHFRDAAAASEARGNPAGALEAELSMVWIDVGLRNRPGDGLRRADEALRRHPLPSMPATDRPYLNLATLYARGGRTPEARQFLAEAVRTGSRQPYRLGGDRHRANGEIALAEGRLQEAITAFATWNDSAKGCTTCGLFEMGLAYERGGRPDSALATYERYLATAGLGPWFTDRDALALTYRRLGELYEQRGNRDKAMESYNKVLDLWKDADPELQPVLQDARQRLARLAKGQ